MSINVTSKKEKDMLKDYLMWVEDDLIAVYDLFKDDTDADTMDSIIEAIDYIAAARININVSNDETALRNLPQRIDKMIAEGKSDIQIAKDLMISTRTVERCRRMR